MLRVYVRIPNEIYTAETNIDSMQTKKKGEMMKQDRRTS